MSPEEFGRLMGRTLAKALLAAIQIAIASVGGYLICTWAGGPQTPIQQSMIGLLVLIFISKPDKP